MSHKNSTELSCSVLVCLVLVQLLAGCIAGGQAKRDGEKGLFPSALEPRRSSLPDIRESDKEALEQIKKDLGFEEWRSRTRNGRRIHVFDLDVRPLLPPDVRCQSQAIEAPWPAYRITCTRGNQPENSQKNMLEKIEFKVQVFPSLEDAREAIARRFLFVSAPIAYLKKQWATERVDYGDVHFGMGIWGTGNLVFELTEGSRDVQLVNAVFMAIDRALTEIGKRIEALPETLILSVKSVTLAEGKAWKVQLQKQPAGSQVVLLMQGLYATGSRKDEVILRSDEVGEAALVVVIVQSGARAESLRIPLPSHEPATRDSETQPPLVQ